jgi:hypothetical protein
MTPGWKESFLLSFTGKSAIKPKWSPLRLISKVLIVSGPELRKGFTEVLCIPPDIATLAWGKTSKNRSESKHNNNSGFLINIGSVF